MISLKLPNGTQKTEPVTNQAFKKKIREQGERIFYVLVI